MKTQLLSCIIFSLAWSLSAAGLPPEGSFRLTVNEIVGTGHCRGTLELGAEQEVTSARQVVPTIAARRDACAT